MYNKISPLVFSFVLLSGCATTAPLSGASIQYKLPATSAEVKIELFLEKCEIVAGDPEIKIRNISSLKAVAGKRDETYSVSGDQLAASWIKRDINITTDERGVLKSINSTNEDRTVAALTNIVKTGVSIAKVALGVPSGAGFIPGPPVEVPLFECNEDTTDALKDITRLKVNLKSARERLAIARGNGLLGLDHITKMNAIATEVVRVQNTKLKVEFSKKIKFPSAQEQVILELDYAKIGKKWLNFYPGITRSPEDVLHEYFGVIWSAKPVSPQITRAYVKKLKKTKACRAYVYTPNTNRGLIVVESTGLALLTEDKSDGVISPAISMTVKTPVGQWGDPDQLCIDARFGENRTTNLTYDKFGRRTSFAWKSNASVEGATGGMPSLIDGANTLYTTLSSPGDLAIQKAEVGRLTIVQSYNQLKACEAIIEAGGYSCEP